jgi:hypothetical protein
VFDWREYGFKDRLFRFHKPVKVRVFDLEWVLIYEFDLKKDDELMVCHGWKYLIDDHLYSC